MPSPHLHPVAPHSAITCQIAIIGGGIAGLWTACRLQQLGHHTCLIEQHALGSDQTLASQGILHGGIKYALSPAASSAAAAIAGMPAIWKSCLQGQGELDLRRASITSDAQWMWTAGSTLASLTAMVASKVIRTSVRTVAPHEACPGLHAAPASRSIYRVEEPILDIASVVRALVEQYTKLGGTLVHARAERAADGHYQLQHPDGTQRMLVARFMVFSAGQGNQALSPQVASQQRPLQMVMLRRASLPAVFGHCIAPLSDKPRLTITTHHLAKSPGESIWYIGGQIAEHGAEQSPKDVIAATRRELAECLPWIDLTGAQYATCRWIRAEGLTPDGKRPDEPVIHVQQTGQSDAPACIITAWPTKLVFAPLVAQRIVDQIASITMPANEAPKASTELRAPEELRDLLPSLQQPSIAPVPWDRPEVIWS